MDGCLLLKFKQNRPKADLGPDYMSRAGPVSRTALVCQESGCSWPGCHVIAKLIFVAFNKRVEIPANSH